MRFAVLTVAVLAVSAGVQAAHPGAAARGVAIQKIVRAHATTKTHATTLAQAISIAAQPKLTHPKFVEYASKEKKRDEKKLLQDEECTQHSDCEEDNEYCDEYNDCYACSACESFDDAIDGECPDWCEDDENSGEEGGGPNLDFADLVCLSQNSGPCLLGLFGDALSSVMDADSATAATAALDEFCTNCTDAADEFTDALSTCNITDADTVEYFGLFGEVLDNSCADTECGAGILYALQDTDERRDDFCEYAECGLDVVEPFLELSLGDSELDTECVTGYFELFCLEDSESGNYCLDELDGDDDNDDDDDDDDEFDIAPFCESSCAVDMTLAFNELATYECGFDFDFAPECEDSDSEYTLLDYCTVNEDGDYCLEVLAEGDGPMCDFDGGDVPAPGPDDSTCPTACQSSLEDFVEAVGCCVSWMLDFQCVDTSIVDFVTDDCGVSLGDQCARLVLPTVSDASMVVTRSALVFAAAVVSAASLM